MSSRRSGYRKEVTMSERLVRGILKAVDEKDGSVPQLIAHGLVTRVLPALPKTTCGRNVVGGRAKPCSRSR